MDNVPDSVLSERIFVFLTAIELSKCVCLVSKSWKSLADSTEPWEANCRRTWRGKEGMSFSFPGAPELPFAKIKLTNEAIGRLSVKELRMFLQLRKVDPSRFIEKAEYQREFIATSPVQVMNWSIPYDNVWKASYVYAWMDSKRDDISKDELVSTSWTMFMKDNRFTCDFRFLPDGSVSSIFAQVSRWRMLGNSPRMLQVDQYPPLHVSRRRRDWGWKMENMYVVFYSNHYACDVKALFQNDFPSAPAS